MRRLSRIAGILGLGLVLGGTLARAQVPGLDCSGCEALILNALGWIYHSLSTPGGAGRYASDAGFLSSQTQLMQSGIFDATGFDAVFLGWVDLYNLPAEEAADNGRASTEQTLATMKGAIGVATAYVNNFPAEEAKLEKLELCNVQAGTGGSLMQAVQCGNEIALHNGQIALLNGQLEATKILLDAVAAGAQINALAGYGGTNEGVQLHTAQAHGIQ